MATRLAATVDTARNPGLRRSNRDCVTARRRLPARCLTPGQSSGSERADEIACFGPALPCFPSRGAATGMWTERTGRIPEAPEFTMVEPRMFVTVPVCLFLSEADSGT